VITADERASLKVEKAVEIGRFLRLKRFVGERERTLYWMR